MDNRDWILATDAISKHFFFERKEEVEGFIRRVRKLAKEKEQKIRFRRISEAEVRVKVLRTSSGTFKEKEVILINLINAAAR